MKEIGQVMLGALVLLSLVGCQPIVPPVEIGEQSEPTATDPGPTPTSTAPAVPTATAHVVQEVTVTPDIASSSLVLQAIDDLAARLGVAPDVIDVVRVEEVDWPDGSLGCPQPDMRYPQVLVNGSFIQLQVGNQTYHYHSGGGRPPFLCTSKDEVLPEDLPPELRGGSGS